MIYYFSGTGNSKWLAQQLALKTGDKALNMIGLSEIPSVHNQTIGLVFPIYAWSVPEPVLDFMKSLQDKPAFAFSVCTCAEEAGNAMDDLNSIFPLHSTWSVVMPSNYVMGSDVESDESIAAKISKAKTKIDLIAADVLQKKSVHDVNKGSLSWIKSNLFSLGFNQFARNTKKFYATDKCNSCGLCAKLCPANSITMKDGIPHWGEMCYRCTACINCCPTKAIQYGKSTVNRGRYYLKED